MATFLPIMDGVGIENRPADAMLRVAVAVRSGDVETLWDDVPEDQQAAWLGYVAAGRLKRTRRVRAVATADLLRDGSLIDHRPPRCTDGLGELAVRALLEVLMGF